MPHCSMALEAARWISRGGLRQLGARTLGAAEHQPQRHVEWAELHLANLVSEDQQTSSDQASK